MSESIAHGIGFKDGLKGYHRPCNVRFEYRNRYNEGYLAGKSMCLNGLGG